jgi:predicted secreted hydrolase
MEALTGSPVFMTVPAELGAHTDPFAEIWYVTCHLASAAGTDAARRFGAQAMVTSSPSGKVFTSVSLSDAQSGTARHAIAPHRADEATIAVGELDIVAGDVALQGPMKSMTLQAAVPDAQVSLTLTPAYPVIYNCGTGVFPYFGGATHQFALPGLSVSGSITWDGGAHDVTGSAWFDRQWSTSRDAFGTKNAFTWFGLWLDDGRALSLWDITDRDSRGNAWATVVAPDGTHTVVAMTPLETLVFGARGRGGTAHEQPEHWVVELPGIATTLTITHELIHQELRFYSGLCTVAGTTAGQPVSGRGVVDTVPR